MNKLKIYKCIRFKKSLKNLDHFCQTVACLSSDVQCSHVNFYYSSICFTTDVSANCNHVRFKSRLYAALYSTDAFEKEKCLHI